MPQNLKKLNLSIGILGLGYVGLPLAIEFGKYFRVFGYQIWKNRQQISGKSNVSVHFVVFFEIFIENGLEYLLFSTGSWEFNSDPIHLNDIQPVDFDGEFWQKGDVFYL